MKLIIHFLLAVHPLMFVSLVMSFQNITDLMLLCCFVLSVAVFMLQVV